MELVYKLNLPPFHDIIKEDFLGFPNDNDYEYITDDNLSKVLKSEYTNIKNLNWKSYRYFKKSNMQGSIHTDAAYEDLDNPNKCIWGINWIFDGSGLIRYWNLENLIRTGFTPGSKNKPYNGIVPRFTNKKSHDYEYFMEKDSVYLVNASKVHCAIGSTNRKAFSLRTDSYRLGWKDVVKLFDDLIIKN